MINYYGVMVMIYCKMIRCPDIPRGANVAGTKAWTGRRWQGVGSVGGAELVFVLNVSDNL